MVYEKELLKLLPNCGGRTINAYASIIWFTEQVCIAYKEIHCRERKIIMKCIQIQVANLVGETKEHVWDAIAKFTPQLDQLLFLIYINDIGDNLTSPTRLFADDCVLYREITNPSNRITLQQDLDLIPRWSQLWQLPLNLSKCNALCITTKRNYPPTHHYTLNNTKLHSHI